MLLGIFAVLVTPREEEPQINVTMANVIVPAPGASANQVETLVTTPMEKVLAEISGVKHIYSVSRPGAAVLTVQFEVGEDRTDAIVRLYNAIYSNQDWRPADVGILQPLVKPKGIDDVPILSVTLWTRDPQRGAYELRQVAHAIEAEIKRVPGTRNVYTIGGPDETVHVSLDPQRLAGYGLTVSELAAALQAASVVQHAGTLVANGGNVPVQAGEFLADRDEVAQLVVAVREGRPIYLQDVATITAGPDQPEQYVTFGAGPAGAQKGIDLAGTAPAVTLAISKKPGENAIDVTNAVLQRIEQLRGSYIPEGVEITVTRNYGETANDKALKLIQKLMFATASVVLLVWLTVGWREAIVVGAAVVITLAATLFASWAYGFTINRVSLFALIFSIGILVDDAIVVVENIHRHMGFGSGPLEQIIPRAVDEVGGPTILATFTVIAALLPMAFVSGLMGPYMSPIPINASMGMLISLAIALVFTPWLSKRMLAHADVHPAGHGDDTRLQRFFERIIAPFLRGDDARRRRHRLYLGTLAAILVAISLVALELVVMKMLPFDNKSEFQVVVDMPEGTALEETGRMLDELAAEIVKLPEVTDYQVYAGTAAPINFNGLVRQYYLRSGHELGDIQVNLVDKHHRDRKSHEIALAVRPALAEIGRKYGAAVKIVEVPPGPPVQAPLVAEIYGPFYGEQQQLTREVRKVFDAKPQIVDVDDSLEAPNPRLVVRIDRQKAALLGVSQAEAVQVLAAGLGGLDATYVQIGRENYPIPVRLELDVPDKADLSSVLALQVRTRDGANVALSEVAIVERKPWDNAIYHKDLLPLTYRHRGLRRRDRQPAVRHVRPGRGAQAPAAAGRGTGAALLQPAGRPLSAEPEVGWRVADHVRDVPRHGTRVLGGPDPDLPAGRRAVRFLCRAAGDHGADSAHDHRRDAGTCAARSAVHRDLDDRHDRARRHHRPQLDPARGLHQRRAGARARPGRCGHPFGGRARAAHRAHRGGRHDRRVLHPRRSHLQRARRVADLRHPRLDSADAGADPDPLFQLSQPHDQGRVTARGNAVMAKVVILGAGLGGVACAYEMKKKLGAAHQVTLVGSSPYFEFTPSNPWVAVGWRKPEQTRVELAGPLADKDVRWLPKFVQAIDAANSKLLLQDGTEEPYDYLAITTGPKLAFDEVPGLGPNGHTVSICTQAHALAAWEQYQEFVKNPGPIVVGAAGSASCFGPAYEMAMILDTDLRRRKIRDKVPMTYVTSEPYIGHMGLGGVGDSKGLMESTLRQRHIQWVTNAKVTSVEPGTVHAAEHNEDGTVRKEHKLPFKFAMILPAFKGVDAVAAVPDLCNPRGFVLIDEHQRSKKYRNIFSAGVCVAIPPVEATPVPTGAPKTGFMIESMVHAICENVAADIAGRAAESRGTWNAICLADFGDTGAAFVALPQIPPRNVTWAREGKWVHLAKVAFEKYFLRKVQTGSITPIYEKYVLKTLGIEALKQ